MEKIICPQCLIEISDEAYHKTICMAKERQMIIEVRQDCKECGKDIVNARQRTFCDKPCRIKWHNRERQAYQTKWLAEKRKRLRGKTTVMPTLDTD
jgi:hypothetical protein